MGGFPYYQQYNNPYQQSYYQQIQQPMAQQQMPNQPTQAQVSNVWIYSEAEVAGYPVAPNNAVRRWSANEPVFYLKWADATGKPSVKIYDIVERDNNTLSSQSKASEQAEEYAKKSDLATVVDAVKDFSGIIASIKADVDSMKGDMYGIAGKKKTVKKAEVSEDDE